MHFTVLSLIEEEWGRFREKKEQQKERILANQRFRRKELGTAYSGKRGGPGRGV